MSSRKVDNSIKEELLEKVLKAISQKGLNNLSLRGIADEIGINARMLIYHFKSYDALIDSVFIKLSKDHKASLLKILSENDMKSFDDLFNLFIKDINLEKKHNTLILFLEFYTKAVRSPKEHSKFLHEVLDNWIDEVESLITPKYGVQARYYATMIVACYRGLMLDWLASGDKKRVIKTSQVFVSLLSR